MKIALLVPSRERLDKKLELVNSIKDTVSNIDNVSLYFGTDNDDPTREQAKELFKNDSFVKFVPIETNGKFLNLGIMWNICAKASTEEIISMIGDDMVFITKNWDLEILKEFSPEVCPSDNFKMIYCYDGRHGAKVAVNCFIHRVYMDLTGYFCREEFPVDKIDIWLQQIYNSFKRLYYRGDIHIEHKHWSFRKSAKDIVACRMRENNAEDRSNYLWSSLLTQRMEEAQIISKKLNLPYDPQYISTDMQVRRNARD
jgi:hypothetical protein